MNTILIYGIIFVILIALELVYFKIADTFNIIDKPNERSSHSTIVLRGGGIIFLFSLWIWSVFLSFPYIWFLLAVTLVAGVSFIDDTRFCKTSGSIYCHGDDVLSVGHFALGYVADSNFGSYRMCGCVKRD